MKLSVSMICWNESKTIDLSIKSLRDFADELIIVDTGSFDGTREIARETMNENDLSGEIYNKSFIDLGKARLYSMNKTSLPWRIMLDSNIVLSNKVKSEIDDHIKHDRKHGLSLKSLNLMGDYEHYFNHRPYMSAHRVLTHRDFKYKMSLDRPKWFGRFIPISAPAVNLSRVRQAWRSWYRGEPFEAKYYKKKYDEKPFSHEANTQRLWMKTGIYKSPIEFVESVKGLKLEDVRGLAPNWYISQLRQYAKPITQKMRDELPEVIKDELVHPRYTIIYDNGKISWREPTD